MSKKKKTVIEYRHYSLPVKFPVLLLSGNRWRISDIKSGRLHFHNCLEIGICYSDSGIIEIDDEKIPFQAGDVTCLPRYLPHTTYSSPDTQSLWVYLFVDPDELFKNLFRASEQNLENPLSSFRNYKFILNKAQYPKVYSLATTIVDEMQHQQPNYQESVKGLMLALYIELLRIHHNEKDTQTIKTTKNEESPNQFFAMAPVIDAIYNNYMNPITVEDLAALSNLSTTHFRRLFHETMGTSPLDFINSTRIDEACKLLRSSDDSILNISEKVGFRSISSFNRFFVKLMHVSPREWRNKTLKAEESSAKASILKFTGWV